jgi:hypothetical protein
MEKRLLMTLKLTEWFFPKTISESRDPIGQVRLILPTTTAWRSVITAALGLF